MSKTAISLLYLCHAIQGSWAAPKSSVSARQSVEPAEFTANPDIGPGGSVYKDSPHFRVYGNSGSEDQALGMLEAAYDCFIGTLGFRSTGLSYNDNANDGPWTKVNIYSVDTLTGAAGVMHSDYVTGMAWLEVVDTYLASPFVTVHEYGHGIHYHQQTWVDQGRTGAWWETFANWVADTESTSDICASSRAAHGQPTGNTQIDLHKLIDDSFQVIVDGSVGSGNYYQAWPFLTYLTSNPDDFSNLGQDTLHQMMVQYAPDSNETPLHTLQRVAGSSTSVQQIVGRYWAHMAYVDIGHPQAHDVFLGAQASFNYNNVQSTGGSSYSVIDGRQPLYMGANIIPLQTSGGTVSVDISAGSDYTATLVAGSDGSYRYVDVDGSGSVDVAQGEEVSLVVANTPELVLYDPFNLSGEVTQGLEYSFTLSGASVA